MTFSDVLRHCSQAAWETSQKVTHLKIILQLARLTVKLLRVGYRKRRYTYGDINSHFNHFERHSSVTFIPT